MRINPTSSFTTVVVFFAILIFSPVYGLDADPSFQRLELKDCLLPNDHPLQPKLKKIFKKKSMFKTASHLRKEGFEVFNRAHRGLMVARHSSVKNYLFKKFQDGTSNSKQIKNYVARVSGARALRQFIDAHQLNHIVVPEKWIYPLPTQFSDAKTKERAYILIAECMPICSESEVANQYYNMDLELLQELCFVLFHFRGLDSVLANMPTTRDNKIAFIDTERWDHVREQYLMHAMPHLSPERQEYALSIFKELEGQ